MAKEHVLLSGAPTPFNDKDGTPIKIHDYVKDAEGNRYYINSHCQAVPEVGDAPAVELASLVEEASITVLSAEEVLNAPRVERKRRGGRRKKEDAQRAQQAIEDFERERAQKEAAAKAAKEAEEAAARAAQEAGAQEGRNNLSPVSLDLVLNVIPDDALANELRRRGYTLCAVRPALIEL